MQMLAAHPEVVVFRRFPYESTPRYWLHAARVLTEPVNFVESQQPDTFGPMVGGQQPYHDDRVYEQDRLEAWLGGAHVEHGLRQQTIDDWYDARRRQAQPDLPTSPRSVWPYLPDLIWELYPRAKKSSSCVTSTWRARS
jgi:hypothetical protein